MHEKERELVGLISSQYESMQAVHDLLKSLFKDTLEKMLEAEMDEHLRYKKIA